MRKSISGSGIGSGIGSGDELAGWSDRRDSMDGTAGAAMKQHDSDDSAESDEFDAATGTIREQGQQTGARHLDRSSAAHKAAKSPGTNDLGYSRGTRRLSSTHQTGDRANESTSGSRSITATVRSHFKRGSRGSRASISSTGSGVISGKVIVPSQFNRSNSNHALAVHAGTNSETREASRSSVALPETGNLSSFTAHDGDSDSYSDGSDSQTDDLPALKKSLGFRGKSLDN